MADIKTAAIRAICHALDESEPDVITELARLDSGQLGRLARAADLVSGVASVELSNRDAPAGCASCSCCTASECAAEGGCNHDTCPCWEGDTGPTGD